MKINKYDFTPTLRDKINLQFVIMDLKLKINQLLVSPYPNDNQYLRTIQHLRTELYPYADEKFKKAERELLETLKKELKFTRNKTQVNNQNIMFHQNLAAELNSLIKRLGIGLETEGYEVLE